MARYLETSLLTYRTCNNELLTCWLTPERSKTVHALLRGSYTTPDQAALLGATLTVCVLAAMDEWKAIAWTGLEASCAHIGR